MVCEHEQDEAGFPLQLAQTVLVGQLAPEQPAGPQVEYFPKGGEVRVETGAAEPVVVETVGGMRRRQLFV